jgi:DNA-directed RNA polymerase specialized sigma24 family protein
MHLEPLVRRAQEGDVKAFVELTRGYQHLAFGSALALIHDLQQAEDVVQEAFLPAWSVPGRFRRFAGIPQCRRKHPMHLRSDRPVLLRDRQ